MNVNSANSAAGDVHSNHPRIQEIEREYALLWNRVLIHSAELSSTLDSISASDAIEQKLFENHITGKSGLADILKDLNPTVSVDFAAKALATQAVKNSAVIVSAACIVLGHSLADDILNRCCAYDIELSPDEWFSELNFEKKFSLKQIKERGLQGIIAAELERYKNGVGAKSLPNRADIFFGRVTIRQHKRIPPSDPTYFTLAALKEVDDVRHQIVHNNGTAGQNLITARQYVYFLTEASLVFLRSVGIKHNFKVDPDLVLKGHLDSQSSTV